MNHMNPGDQTNAGKSRTLDSIEFWIQLVALPAVVIGLARFSIPSAALLVLALLLVVG